MHLSLWRRLGALAGVVAILIWTAAGAAAQPAEPQEDDGTSAQTQPQEPQEDDGTSAQAQPQEPQEDGETSALTESPTLSLRQLSSSSSIDFHIHRNTDSATLSFASPPGLAPIALNARLDVPISLKFGRLIVTQGDRTISRVELPLEDQADIVIPLAGVETDDDRTRVTLTVSVVPVEDYCWDYDAPIRLVDGSITFTGQEVAPTTVAGFLPPVLRKLTIALPSEPTLPESNAAVQLAAAIADRYDEQRPEWAVVPLADGETTLPGQPLPLERRIILKEGPDKGLSLQGESVPDLLISGTGDDLTNQVRLLTDGSLRYALSRTVVTDTLPEEPEIASDTTTVEQLYNWELTSETLWPKVGIDLDQTRFGHSVAGLRVHLLGSYTPIPEDFGGEVLIKMGGETLDRWPTESSGVIDRWVDIPDWRMTRSSTLQVSVHTSGYVGYCDDYLPMALRIYGDSRVEALPADLPVPPGFRSLPQALMPLVHVGIGGDTFGDTVRAAQIVFGLQRISQVPLVVNVISLEYAVASGDPAILIAADAWTDDAIALPFTADQGRITVEAVDGHGSSTSLTLDPAVRFGSLQVAFDGQRTLLIATSNKAPEELDRLLGWLTSKSGRWFGLDGRAIISVAGSDPVIIPNPADLSSESSDEGEHPWVLWALGAVVGLATASALVILGLLRARRT